MHTPYPLDLLGLADIRAARELLGDVVKTTPLIPSRPLTEITGTPAWLKCENQQRAGSYKVRGAYTRIARLSPAERARGVVAASATPWAWLPAEAAITPRFSAAGVRLAILL